MKCNHCGLCCKDPLTQINVTLGDIFRISEHMGISIEELFKEYIGLNPFADSDLIHYELDLGLNLPCKFRIDDRCSVYSVRPVNCRLFPYWILVEAPPEKLKDILSEHKCSYDMLRRKDYSKYKEIVAGVLLEESKLFELNKKINVARMNGYSAIRTDDFRKKELEKIKLIKEKSGVKLDIAKIKEIIEKNKESFNENKIKLDQAERIIR